MWELLRKYKIAVGTGTLLLAAFVFFSLNLRNKEQENPVERFALGQAGAELRGLAAQFLVAGRGQFLVPLVDLGDDRRHPLEVTGLIVAKKILNQFGNHPFPFRLTSRQKG